jgi:hypothetical protein
MGQVRPPCLLTPLQLSESVVSNARNAGQGCGRESAPCLSSCGLVVHGTWWAGLRKCFRIKVNQTNGWGIADLKCVTVPWDFCHGLQKAPGHPLPVQPTFSLRENKCVCTHLGSKAQASEACSCTLVSAASAIFQTMPAAFDSSPFPSLPLSLSLSLSFSLDICVYTLVRVILYSLYSFTLYICLRFGFDIYMYRLYPFFFSVWGDRNLC